MTLYPIPEELERALDRWVEQLPEPRPVDRPEALVWALRDFLTGQGVIPHDEPLENDDDRADDGEKIWREKYETFLNGRIISAGPEIKKSKLGRDRKLISIALLSVPTIMLSWLLLGVIVASALFFVSIMMCVAEIDRHSRLVEEKRNFLRSFSDRPR